MADERRLKYGLNYPLCRGYVSSCCVVFITVMFTFISTCLKWVTISSPSLSRADCSCHPLDSVLQTDAIKQRKCFVCLPLAQPRARSRLYLSECTGGIVSSTGPSFGMCISLSCFKGWVHIHFKLLLITGGIYSCRYFWVYFTPKYKRDEWNFICGGYWVEKCTKLNSNFQFPETVSLFLWIIHRQTGTTFYSRNSPYENWICTVPLCCTSICNI